MLWNRQRISEAPNILCITKGSTMAKANSISLSRMALAVALVGSGSAAMAVDFSYSGFLNVTAGKVFGASGQDIGYPDPGQWRSCPACYVADFSHGSVYENKWSLTPESRAGLQGTLTMNDKLSFTGQIMARHAARDAKVELEWAFVTYNLSPKLTLQAGRKRLPLFFYSDFQDVSFAYNWVRVPPDVYGWAVVNYNGANITYRDDWAGWAVKSNLYVGKEHSKDNPIAKLVSPARTDVHWDQMVGVDLELNRDWFTARVSHNRSRQSTYEWTNTGRVQTSPATGSSSPQQFSSLAFNIDKDNWIARSEFSIVKRSPARGDFKGYLLSAGYRFGNVLPMLTMSQLKAYGSGDNPPLAEIDRNVGVTVRYQLNDSSSLKLQVDRSRWDYLNGTDTVRKLVTVSYDMIF